MSKLFPHKKKLEEISLYSLGEMALSKEDDEDFFEGIRLFNEQQFWHAHESWEKIWQRHPEDERIFFQGIIQLAAAYHQLVTERSFTGMMNNFEKAKGKLSLFPHQYLRINVGFLLESVENAKNELIQLGEENRREFNRALIPKIII